MGLCMTKLIERAFKSLGVLGRHQKTESVELKSVCAQHETADVLEGDARKKCQVQSLAVC